MAHTHSSEPSAERRIAVALVLTLAGMAVSIVGGVVSHSLALISDAGHMLADAGALALALMAQRVASRPRTGLRTYGWRRAETLAAFVNAILLGVASVWVVIEAVERWRNPPQIHGRFMLSVAVLGLLVNLVAAWVLSRGRTHNENTRAALAHVLSDAAGSIAAIGAALLVLAWGWQRADPVLSVVLAVMIFWGAWSLVTRTLDVLMEGTPRGLDSAALERTIGETPGVSGFHDLHAWTISEGFNVVTVHVVLDGKSHGTEVSEEVCRRVRDAHGISHVTVQAEPPMPPIHFQPLSTITRRQD